MTSREAGRRQIDEALAGAVARGEVPGVVAMAAGADGPLYEGAFGVRSLADGTAMTLDTVFHLASMTKALTSVAAMGLVEEGRLALEAPVPDIGEPALNAPQVLEGFDRAGKPQLRPAKRPITLKHLLTHTAGFAYDWCNAETLRYVRTTGAPSNQTGRLAALRLPLVFDPGDRWAYGINTDWIGRLVEAVAGRPLDAVLRERILAPLGMADTGFAPSAEQRARQASVHQRRADGTLDPQPLPEPFVPEFWSGGGGLHATAGDYLRFLQMLLHAGSLGGVRILRPETVALMHRNHTGDLPAGVARSTLPERSNDVDFFPGAPLRWSLAHMLNLAPGPDGRSGGTVGWGGLFNLYYWLDPARRVTGLIMTQILPFADPAVLRLYGRLERGVYALLA